MGTWGRGDSRQKDLQIKAFMCPHMCPHQGVFCGDTGSEGRGSMTPAEFRLVYDFRDAQARRQAREHRALWGKRLTDCHALDQSHVLLVFRSGGARWLPWEERRKKQILGRKAVA